MVGLLCVVIVSFWFLSQSKSQSQTEYLFGGRVLGEQELNSVEIAFSRAGLNEWRREQSRIQIPRSSRSQYLAALDETAALPMSVRTSLQQAIDKASLFEPTSQREARQRHAKEKDLGTKLGAFAEIQWASVEHDVGEREGLSGQRKQSASVVVCPQGKYPLSPGRIEAIREFIRGAYAGMRAEDVVVIDTKADPSFCLNTDPLARKKREAEAQLEHEILGVLQGYGEIRVKSYVQLSPSSTAIQPSHTGNQPDQDGHRKVAKVDLLSEVVTAVTNLKSDRTSRMKVATQPVSVQPTAKAMAKEVCEARLESVRVSIGIPESFYQQAWVRNQTGDTSHVSTSQLQSVREHVHRNIVTAVSPIVMSRASSQTLAGIPIQPNIDVWSYPDSVVGEPTVSNILPQVPLDSFWFKAVIVGVVAVFAAIFLLFSISSRSSKEHRTSQEIVAPSLSQETSARRDLEAEFTSLVEQNPDEAIQVLQNWLAEAA